jgi:hypothetical protein
MWKYREKFQISTGVWQEYLSGKWQYWSILDFILKPSYSSYLAAYEDGTDSVSKHRHIKFRYQAITQKKAYSTGVISMCCQLSLHFVLVGLYLRLYSFSCIVLVSVHIFEDLPHQRQKRFPTVDLFIGRVSSGYKIILTGGFSMKKKRFGNIGLHCYHPHIQIFFSDVLVIYSP